MNHSSLSSRRVAAYLCVVLGIAAATVSTGRSDADAALPEAAFDLYVSTVGSDANDGLSAQAALATLKEALRRARPGTIVRVLPGTYFQTTRHRLVGQPAAPISIRGEGGRPVFSGQRRERWGLWLEESSHVVLERLAFRDYTDIGVVVVGSMDVTLRRLRVQDNGFAPQIGWVEGYGIHLDESSGLLVERNRVFRNGPNPRPWNSAGTGINGFAMRDAVIRRNRSFDNHGGGVLVEDSFDVLVMANRIYRNDLDVSADEWWDGGIWVDGGANVKLVRNRIEANLGPGIEISDEDCQQPTGYVLRNNTSSGNYFGIYVWNFGTTDFPADDVLMLDGNDFSGNTQRDVWITAWEIDC